MSGFDDWLEELSPGASSDGDPVFPRALGLEPLGVIGRGGTGVVYKARDPVLDREVAVKISRPSGGAAARESMMVEARRTALLRHPAIVPIHGVVAALDGEAEGLISILGADQARVQAEMLADQAVKHLDLFGPKADSLREIADFVVNRNS